jgi:FkbM family methyltransferase
MMPINRKRFLRDTGLATAGVAVGAVGRSLFAQQPAVVSPPGSPPAVQAVVSGPPVESTPTPAGEVHGDESFSQAGEDVIVGFFFQFRGIGNITYLDIGANDPVKTNNTYYFYRRGFRGVLVEPNVSLCEKLRSVRPGDETLNAGIGVSAVNEADYYIMSHHSWNTFSSEEAAHQTKTTKGQIHVEKVVKMPLLNINDVMQKHFRAAPTFLSVDTEGLDLAILKSIDYARFRPMIICAETLVSSTTRTRPEIPEFMATQGYVARGGSFVNTIFVDSKIL